MTPSDWTAWQGARHIGIALHNCAMTEEVGLGIYRIVLRFPGIDRMHEMGRLLVAARTLAREDAEHAAAPPTTVQAAVEAEREACALTADALADAIKLRRGEDGKADRRDPFNEQMVAIKVALRDASAAIRARGMEGK